MLKFPFKSRNFNFNFTNVAQSVYYACNRLITQNIVDHLLVFQRPGGSRPNIIDLTTNPQLRFFKTLKTLREEVDRRKEEVERRFSVSQVECYNDTGINSYEKKQPNSNPHWLYNLPRRLASKTQCQYVVELFKNIYKPKNLQQILILINFLDPKAEAGRKSGCSQRSPHSYIASSQKITLHQARYRMEKLVEAGVLVKSKRVHEHLSPEEKRWKDGKLKTQQDRALTYHLDPVIQKLLFYVFFKMHNIKVVVTQSDHKRIDSGYVRKSDHKNCNRIMIVFKDKRFKCFTVAGWKGFLKQKILSFLAKNFFPHDSKYHLSDSLLDGRNNKTDGSEPQTGFFCYADISKKAESTKSHRIVAHSWLTSITFVSHYYKPLNLLPDDYAKRARAINFIYNGSKTKRFPDIKKGILETKSRLRAMEKGRVNHNCHYAHLMGLEINSHNCTAMVNGIQVGLDRYPEDFFSYVNELLMQQPKVLDIATPVNVKPRDWYGEYLDVVYPKLERYCAKNNLSSEFVEKLKKGLKEKLIYCIDEIFFSGKEELAKCGIDDFPKNLFDIEVMTPSNKECKESYLNSLNEKNIQEVRSSGEWLGTKLLGISHIRTYVGDKEEEEEEEEVELPVVEKKIISTQPKKVIGTRLLNGIYVRVYGEEDS